MADALEWMRSAPCLGMDSSVFFCEEYDRRAVALAKEICERCPVIDECLAFALETREQFGIYGGLTAKERNRLLRRRKKGLS